MNGEVSYDSVHRCYRHFLPSNWARDDENEWCRVFNGNDGNDEWENELMGSAAPAPGRANSGGLAGALEEFVGEQVERIARDAASQVVRDTVFPTRTVIVTERETRPVDGIVHNQLADCLMAIQDNNLMMCGGAGVGKSQLARTMAESLGVEYMSLSLSSMTPVSQITGMVRATDVTRPLWREFWEHGNALFSFDDFDRAHANTLTVISEALANNVMSFPDGMIERAPNTYICASANTHGRGGDRMYAGANQLDAATLDRFFVVDIEVDQALESSVAHSLTEDVELVERALTLVRQCRANAAVYGLRFLATPRSSFALIKAVNRGMDWETAVNGALRKGVPNDMWAKLTS